MRRVYLVMLGVLAAALLSGCAGGGPGQAGTVGQTPEAVETASAEPAAGGIVFEGTDLEGNPVSSEIFSQSKLTMVNVWATYCGPCLNEMPELGELAAEYDTAELRLIGVVSDVLAGSDQALAESLVQETGADYTHLLVNESIYYALLTDVNAVPTTFFVDQDGVVLGTVIGAKSKPAWEEIIHGLLEKQ